MDESAQKSPKVLKGAQRCSQMWTKRMAKFSRRFFLEPYVERRKNKMAAESLPDLELPGDNFRRDKPRARVKKEPVADAADDVKSESGDSVGSSDSSTKTDSVPVRSHDKDYTSLTEIPFHTPSIWLLLGKPGQGKSHLIKFLLYYFSIDKHVPREKYFRFCAIFTGSAWTSDFVDIVDKSCIVSLKRSDGTFADGQVALQNYCNNLERMREKYGPLPPSCIICDDLVGLLDTNENQFAHFISTFRHLNVTIFLACQYLKKNIGPTVRECVNYFVLFGGLTTDNSNKALYETVGSSFFRSYREFLDYFQDAVAEDHTALLVDTRQRDFRKNFITIKAPAQLPKAKLHFDAKKVIKELADKQKEKPAKRDDDALLANEEQPHGVGPIQINSSTDALAAFFNRH